MAKRFRPRGESFPRPDLRGTWTSCAIASAGRTSRASPRSWRSWCSSSPGCGPATTSHRCPRPCPDRSSPPRRPGPLRRSRPRGARNHLPRPPVRRPPRRGVRGSGALPPNPGPRARPPGGGAGPVAHALVARRGPPDGRGPCRPLPRWSSRPSARRARRLRRCGSSRIPGRGPPRRRIRGPRWSSCREGSVVRPPAGRPPARPTPCAGCRRAGRRSSRPGLGG